MIGNDLTYKQVLQLTKISNKMADKIKYCFCI